MNADAKRLPADAAQAPEAEGLARWLPLAAVAVACALAVLLAVRPISSLDLGYHLAYGEHFLDTGEIVDTNPYIYTVGKPEDYADDDRGPGCWWDDQGRYRFPNANWLTQVLMAWTYRLGGVTGLVVLQVLLVAGTFALGVVVMRRVGLPWTVVAAGLLIMCLGGYPRFSLRPECVSYLVLAGMLAILTGKRVGWRSVAALVGIQLLFVNLHSFFVLGVAITGAFWVESLLRWNWHRMRLADAQVADRSDITALRDRSRQRLLLLSAALTGQMAVCLANPWTWRIVALPVQTLLYMRRHHIGTPDQTTGANSWARIGELYRTLSTPLLERFASVKATITYVLLLGLAGLGAIGLVVRRRWAWLMILAGLFSVSLSVRRNIAVAPLLATPLVLAGLCGLLTGVWQRIGRRVQRRGHLAAAVLLTLGGGWLVFRVVTHKFYYSERLPYRLAGGFAQVVVPVGATDWLNEFRAKGRIWTDFDSSSNLHFFTDPHAGVPVLTNTWPQPPSVLAAVMDYCQGTRDFAEVERAYDPQVVILSSSPGNQALVTRLAKDDRWAVVHIDAAHVVFLRSDGPNATLARDERITAETLDTDDLIARLAEQDPLPAYSIYLGGLTLRHLGWGDRAITVIREALRRDDSYAGAWVSLGLCYAARGSRLLGDKRIQAGRRDLEEARSCFARALERDPDNKAAQRDHRLVVEQLTQLRRGVILQPDF